MKTSVPPIYIQLPDYQYFDSPFSKDVNREVDAKYMERFEIEEQLRARLRDESNSRSGAILVTGYRGCGKTSLVRKVIKDMNHPKGIRQDLWRFIKEGNKNGAGTCLRQRIWDRLSGLLGMGKGKILDAEINIAQDDIDERAILRLIAIELHRVFSRIRFLPFDMANIFYRLLRFTLTLFIALQFAPWAVPLAGKHTWLFPLHTYCPNGLLHGLLSTDEGASPPVLLDGGEVGSITVPGQEFPWFKLIDQVLLPILFGVVSYLLLTRLLNRAANRSMSRSVSRLKDRLETLVSRMHSEVTTEAGGGVGPSSTQGLLAFGMKRSTHQPMAKTKEVEQEIVEVLRVFGDIARPPLLIRLYTMLTGHHVKWGRRRIVFIIDELDKLIPHGTSGANQKDNEDPTEQTPFLPGTHGVKGYENEWVRRRQEAIASLFANLKHFLNVAQAKFIFIGGRELYDATLADTSNRDAFFSSVFSQVLYVPSFLREVQEHEHGTNIGLTTTTERFVTEAILGKSYVNQHRGHSLSLRDFVQHRIAVAEKQVRRTHKNDPAMARAEFEAAKERILFQYAALQNFIVYLTFRSNGIAKNLVRLFERSLVPLDQEDLKKLRKNPDVIIHGEAKGGKHAMFLRLLPMQQQAHALLTYLYRPFLSLHSGFYRSLDDKQQVALTYLLDHLIKYHGIAFSFHQLESAPETIAVNKVPDFRKFLTEVLNRFTTQHLRVVDNGLFGFHFYNKIYHEIAYISKVSDLDAAAMNFTLDESLPVKQYFYKRLHHLIKLDKSKEPLPHAGVLSPTADVHAWLGDLHFYDTEHEEALGQYRAAARFYAPTAIMAPNAQPDGVSWRYQFAEHLNEYIKLTLKQIHCLKKMKAMDDALLLATALSKNVLNAVRDREKENSTYNWRLMVLAVTCKPAIIAKTSRRPLSAEDLQDVVCFLELISPYTSWDRKYRLYATTNMYLGAIMHFANSPKLDWGVAPNPRFETAHDCYLNAILHLLDLAPSSTHPLIEINNALLAPTGIDYPVSRRLVLANCLSKLADTYVIGVSGPKPPYAQLSTMMLEDLNVGAYTIISHGAHGDTVAAMLLAAITYNKAGQNFSAVFQIKKLFYFMIEVGGAGFAGCANADKEVAALRKWARHAIHSYNQHMDGQQLGKFVSQTKKGFHVNMLRHHPKNADVVSYETELFEVDVLYHDLLLRHDPAKHVNTVGGFLEKHQCQTSLQFTRARHLMLCLRYNWARLPQTITIQFSTAQLHHVDLEKLTAPERTSVANLVHDSIYCSLELLAIMELMGPSFMNNHSLMAVANKYMGDWCLIWESMFDMEPDKNSDTRNQALHGLRNHGIRIRKRLASALDGKVESRMDPLMYYTMAREHCRKAGSVHGLGRSYRGFMGDMFFVEDDYMDNLYHFTCALERKRVAGHVHFVKLLDERIAILRSAGRIWHHDERWSDDDGMAPKDRKQHGSYCTCTACRGRQTPDVLNTIRDNWALHNSIQSHER